MTRDFLIMMFLIHLFYKSLTARMKTSFNMRALTATLVLCCIALSAALAEKKTYHGYQVFRTQKLNRDQTEALGSLQVEDKFDFWNFDVSADVMAAPNDVELLEKFFKDHQIQYDLMIEDVEALHQSQNNKRTTKVKAGLDWEDYYGHDDINDFIDGLASSNADWVSTQSIGKSYEGRDMRIIKIEKAGPGAPIAWIEAGNYLSIINHIFPISKVMPINRVNITLVS